MNSYTPVSWRWSRPATRGALFPFAFENEVGRLMKDFFGTEGDRIGNGAQTWTPALNVQELKNEFVVTAELPGVSEKDIQISITDGVLTVSGEKKEEVDRTEGKIHYVGRRYGSFSQQVYLESPVDEDKIDAAVKNGVLTVKLPKSTATPEKTRKISVRAEK